MVPPVARMTTLGSFLSWAAALCQLAATSSRAMAARAFRYVFMSSLPLGLRIDAAVEIGQLDRIEQIGDLLLGEDLLFADDLQDPLAALVGLGGELGGLVVADDRIERRHDADGGLRVVLQHLFVQRDAVDALGAERLRGGEEEMLRFHQRN